MVRPSRLELPTSAMSRQRSNQLSYGRILMCFGCFCCKPQPISFFNGRYERI